MKPLGIAMLSAGFYPYLVGGAEKQALELSRALAARGARVMVLTRRVAGLPSRESVFGLPVFRLPAWGGDGLGALVFLLSCLAFLLRRGSDYDVLHAHLGGSPALAACLAGRILGKRVVIKLGGGKGIGEIARSRHSLLGRAKLRLLRALAPRFAVVSRELVGEAREAGFQDVTVVPNGVDLKVYRPAPDAERARMREVLGWPPGSVFLYAGRFSAEKRLPLALRAFAEAGPSAKDLSVLVGEGIEGGILRREAERLGLGGRARLLSPQEDVAGLYAAADAFVLPSYSEGLSNALLEAMASGLAILASRVGGTADAVEDGVSGLLFERDDEAGLRRGFERLLREPGLARTLGRAARAGVERFSLESTAGRYLELYGAVS